MTLKTSTSKSFFRENLKSLRKREDLTQTDLSLKCNFSKSYIGKIERGDVDPSLESIVRIADVLDVNPILLFVPSTSLSQENCEISDDPQFNQWEDFNHPQSESYENYLNFLSEQIKDYYEHFEAFYEEAPFGDLLVNSDGEILHANRTFEQYVNSELEIHSLEDLRNYVHPSDRDALDNFLDETFSSLSPDSSLIKFKRSSDDFFTGFIKVHRLDPPDSGMFPDCESGCCSEQECVRLLVCDVSQLSMKKTATKE